MAQAHHGSPLGALAAAIERTGAAIHSIHELVIGSRVVEPVPRRR
jgi:hypothetical protein